MEWISENQNTLRLSFFIGTLVVLTVLESFFRRRPFFPRKGIRFVNNIGLSAINAFMTRWTAPVILVTAFDWDQGLQLHARTPFWLEVVVTILIFDLLIYWQHRVFHQFRPIWTLHRVHHSDRDLDASSAVRFHPVEYLLSMIIKAIGISVLGCSIAAFTVFEILLNVSSLFNHANIHLGPWDRILRHLIVTPDMHRVHHSTSINEQNSNYGFFLSIWDRIFKTYVEAPAQGQVDMQIGLSPQLADQRLDQLLIQPLRNHVSK